MAALSGIELPFEGLAAVDAAALSSVADEAALLATAETNAAARVAAGKAEAAASEAVSQLRGTGVEVVGSAAEGTLPAATLAARDVVVSGMNEFKAALFGGRGLIPMLGSWTVVVGVGVIAYNGVNLFIRKEDMDAITQIAKNPYLSPDQKNKAIDGIIKGMQSHQGFFSDLGNIVIIAVAGSLVLMAAYWFFIRRPARGD